MSFVLSVSLTPLARILAIRVGLVDRPDGQRKIHGRNIPTAGGLAILLAGAGALTAALVVSPLRDRLWERGQVLLGLLIASVVICCVGVIDDFRQLRGRHKFLGQLLAVAVVIASGVVVQQVEFFGCRLQLGPLAVLFTAFWLLGAINSLNLIDGMDGLLSCTGLVISLAVAAMAVVEEQWSIACVAVALCGALLGFLRYNFPPATIFLGDSGSMLVGLVLGVLTIHSSPQGTASLALVAPVAIMIIPIFDTTVAIVRRKLTGRSIYATDRGHLHHCLLSSGLSTRYVLLWITLLCLVTLCGALATRLFHSEWFALLAAVCVVVILVSSRLFGYAEFTLIRKHAAAVFNRLFGRSSQSSSRQMEIHLQGTAAWEEVWEQLTQVAMQLNLNRLRLNVNAPAIHEAYFARWDRPAFQSVGTSWHVEMPVVIDGHNVGRLEVTGLCDQEPTWTKIAEMAKLVEHLELPSRRPKSPQLWQFGWGLRRRSAELRNRALARASMVGDRMETMVDVSRDEDEISSPLVNEPETGNGRIIKPR